MNLPNNQIIQIESIELSSGERTGDFALRLCRWGDNEKPLVVVMGGISANRWAIDCPKNKESGWWNQVINSDSTLNTSDFQFLTFEYFSFAPRITNPPIITPDDQALLLRTLQVKLNLPQFHAVVGSSYGGMVSLAFAALFPHSLARLVCIAAADKNSVKSQALRQIQRSIIQLGEQFAPDTSSQKQFIALARSLAMVGYRGEDEWEHRFQHKQAGKALAQVNSYLNHHGNLFADQFSAARYLQLSRSIDYHQVDVSSIKADSLLIGISSDQMVPCQFIQDMSHKFQSSCQTHFIDSLYGHDGFLLEADQLDDLFNHFFNENDHDNFERNHRSASGY